MARQLIILALALLAVPAVAWVPHHPRALPMTRVHSAASEDAVEFALKTAEDASAKFGKDSGAARAMWDAYEEVASSKESSSSTGSGLDEQVRASESQFITRVFWVFKKTQVPQFSSSPQIRKPLTIASRCLPQCEAGDAAACLEYDAQMAELAKSIAKGRKTTGAVKSGLSAVKDVSLAAFAGAKSGAGGKTSPAYAAAKAEAEAAAAKHGADSAEARTAWDIVEEIESSNNSAATMAGLDEECLLETMELCEQFDAALDSLQKSINQQ
jgi:hypothetical protein